MKALTICEPYASLIALPDDDDRAKRVENRTWAAPQRVIGSTIAIHAGKSRNWLGPTPASNYGLRESELTFGAVIAVARLAECVRAVDCREIAGVRRLPAPIERKYGLFGHLHVEGPVCWILREVRRLSEPVPCKGAQGLWDVPPEIIERIKADL